MSIERPMKLVVFGANGATGQWLVRLAAERGHRVTAIMREGASARVPQGVDVVRGDPLDAAFSRISMVSAAGVGDSWKTVAWPLRVVFRMSNIHVDYEDIERAEALLAASGLDWQAIRPTTLTDGPSTGTRRVGRYATTMRIAREDVARFMLDQLEQPRFNERTPMISGAG